jgi:hypothetical protein
MPTEIRNLIYGCYFPSRSSLPSQIDVDFLGRLSPRENLHCASRALFAETWEHMYALNPIFVVQVQAWDTQPFIKLCKMLHRLCDVVVTTSRVRVTRAAKEDSKIGLEKISENIERMVLAHWRNGNRYSMLVWRGER